MRKILITMTMLAVAVITAAGQPRRVEGLSSTQRVLGYTLTDDIDINGAAFGEAGTYTIGATLEPDVLQPYAGCRVVGLRVAAAMSLGRERTFVYDVDNNFTPIVEQKQRLYEGWNNIFFNGEGYVIKGTETLFFGFDYDETQAMVDAEQGGLCSVGEDTEGAFYLFGNYGQGTGLYSISGVGKLCVQLIVDVSSLPAQDMAITFLDAGFKYKKPGEGIDLMAQLLNVGREPLSSYDVSVQIDSDEPQAFHSDQELPDGQQDTWTQSVRLPDDIAVGMHTLTLRLTALNGQPLADGTGKHATATFAVYENTLDRNQVYVEVYTDASTPLSAMLNNALAALTAANNRVCVVNVHRQGTPLAVSDAAYLEQLYAYDYPTFTVNRAYFPGEPYIAYDMNDYLPVFGTDMTAAILGDIVAQDLYSPSFASLQLSGQYDPQTRRLSIDAQGDLLREATAIYGDLALTLMLTEDGVRGSQAVYSPVTQRTTMNNAYTHNHVLRAYVTPTTGTPVTATVPGGLPASAGTYTAHFETTLDSRWQADRMTVVALLTKAAEQVTDDNVKDVDVVNVASLPLSAMDTQGISTAAQADRVPTAVYGIDGRQRSTTARGMSIVRYSDGSVRKVMRGER